MSKNKIDKETALRYFNHLKDCNGYSSKEFEMKEALEDDENFKQIESEFKEAIEEAKKQLPEKRLNNLAQKIKDSFSGERFDEDDEDFDDEDENISYDDVVKKIINDREYDDYDYNDLVFEQRVSFDEMGDEFVGNSKEIELDKVIEKLEKIKAKYPGQKIFINSRLSGTMAVDRVRIQAISTKVRPLYEVYSSIYGIIKNELAIHEREVAAFKRKQKELGL